MSNEILEDDYRIFPCGRLGGKTGVSQYGKSLGDFNETEDALRFIVRHMEQEQHQPNIWWVSDHGNVWQVDKDGNEIKSGGEE